MNTVLEFAGSSIVDKEIISLLDNYRLLPQFLSEMIIEHYIDSFSCTDEEIDIAYKQFRQQRRIITDEELQSWLESNYMTLKQFKDLTKRKLKIEKFKQANWRNQVDSYFYQRKRQLDRVIYSMIQTFDEGLAAELYFRIKEEEESFSKLAREYSQGLNNKTGGLIGPVELGNCPITLANILLSSQAGQVNFPIRNGKTVVIVRLEKFIPAQLDLQTRQRLLDELFKNWLQKQVKQLYATNISSSKNIIGLSESMPKN